MYFAVAMLPQHMGWVNHNAMQWAPFRSATLLALPLGAPAAAPGAELEEDDVPCMRATHALTGISPGLCPNEAKAVDVHIR